MVKIFYLTGLYWLWLVMLIIIFDFSSKYWITTNMTLYETKPLILPFLNLFYVHNYGAIFSFLADKNGWQRWFFIGISTVIVIALLVMMYCNHVSKTFINIAHALLVGGAIGNLIDRIYYGYVIDFIDFYISKWHFATFNIADCSIFMGAILLIVDGWFIGK